jgi:hypothetical protein
MTRHNSQTHLLIGTHLILSCWVVLAIAEGTSSPAPDWVTSHPQSEHYFIGIGAAPIDTDVSDAVEQAWAHAANDLASQMGVTLSSTSRMRTEEDGQSVGSEYHSDVLTSVSVELEGVETYATWQGAGHAWAQVRLSKAEFELRQIEIGHRARDLLVRGRTAEPVEALVHYLQAWAIIQEMRGHPPKVEIDGRSSDLDVEIRIAIAGQLSDIELKPQAAPEVLMRDVNVDAPLKLSATLSSGEPVARLPVSFRFERGRGTLSERAVTDGAGIAVGQVINVGGNESVHTITARVDLEFITDGPLPPGLILPQTHFSIQVSGRRIFVKVQEFNLGAMLDVPQLGPQFKSGLVQQGFELAPTVEGTDLICDILAETRQGNRMGTIHFAYLDLTVSIRNQAGRELYNTVLDNVKASGSDYHQAGLKAFRKAGKQLREEVAADLVTIGSGD